MSKSALDLIKLECPNKHKVQHRSHSPTNCVIIATGEILLLPRIYYTDAVSHPRAFGVTLPIVACSECWLQMNFPEYIIQQSQRPELQDTLAIQNKPKNTFVANDSMPLARHEISCVNADHMAWHEGDSIGVTSDIIVRGLFVLQPLEYISYIDHTVYQGNGKPMNSYTFEAELDCCLHCIYRAWNHLKEKRFDKIREKFHKPNNGEGLDLKTNPDFAATFNYFQATMG